MINFTREDGSVRERALYSYIQKHKTDDSEVQELLNCSGSSILKKYNNYRKKVEESVNTNKSSFIEKIDNFEEATSTSNVILPLGADYTEEDLLKAHGYDPVKWKIVKHQSSKWNSGLNVLISSRITVRLRKPLEGSTSNLIKQINDALELPKVDFSVKTSKTNPQNLLVIPISDLHYGLLSENNTSGNEYNMEIAEQRVKDYVQETVKNVNKSTIDTVLISFGNDFFNCDNTQGATARGTPQDNEASYTTIFDKGVNLGISLVDYLLHTFDKNVKINIIGVQGNHDLQSSHAMTLALYYNYKNNTRVTVDVRSDEKSRYYYTYGNNLIGFGHETKIKECHRIVSSEFKDWSLYKYRTMFLGHLHKEEVLDTGALVVRRLPILSGKSTWTDSMGYMSNPRAQSFVFNYEKGLVNIINCEVE